MNDTIVDSLENMEENLLDVWLDLTAILNNERMVSTMSFNEAFVCNLLYHALEEGMDNLTATELCAKTRMLKSQMNRVLNELEEKGLIRRERSSRDRRKVYIQLNEEGASSFLEQHREIIAFVNRLITCMGEEKSIQLTQLLHEMITSIQQIKKGD